MGIQSFLKAQKGDPDWAFTPEQYFDKEFKIIDANTIELARDKMEQVVLRQEPSEREMLAKHLKIEVCEGATLDLNIINEASNKLQQVFIYDIRIREAAYMNMGLFIRGGKLNKHIIQVTLDEGASFNGYGHMLNDIGGDCEIITKVTHTGPLSVSSQFYSGEAGKDSQTVYQGMVNVLPEAKYSRVTVDNANLITGENGSCQGVPEIYNHTDSAKINSGSSSEGLDREKIYYLQTRGVSKDLATKMLVDKHRDQSISIIPHDEIREEITQLYL